VRSYKRLTAAQVAKLAAARTPGKYADGDGLSLVIAKSGVASWVYRYMIAGKSHETRLGPVRDVGLARAREFAYDARQLKREGVDPVAARRSRRRGTAVAQVKTPTLAQCA
jgi:Arm DNA-binding domain